jgi:hypothetical protein
MSQHEQHALLLEGLLWSERRRLGSWSRLVLEIDRADRPPGLVERSDGAAVARILSRVARQLPYARGAPVAHLVGAPGDDLLPALFELCLRERGWRTERSGDEATAQALAEGEVDLVVLFPTGANDAERAASLGARARHAGAGLVLAGVWAEALPVDLQPWRAAELVEVITREPSRLTPA